MKIYTFLNTEVSECHEGCSCLCQGCNTQPGEVYYDDGRPLCYDCLEKAMADDAVWKDEQ